MEAEAEGRAPEKRPSRPNKPSCKDRRCTGVEAMAEANLERERERIEAAEQRAAELHYNGFLLAMAEDLGERMLKAFETPTSIPYGTVNLRHGIPPGETVVSSLAGAGSLSLEFTMLSELTGRPEFGEKAQAAAIALYNRRTTLGLLGKHVNIVNGKWTETVSGIGSNADSFFEYLAKMYLLFGDEAWWWRFLDTYDAINLQLRHGDWYADVDMYSGKPRRHRFENLMAFWPGLQVLVGELPAAARTLNAFYLVWRDWGFLPEEYVGDQSYPR